MKKLKCVHSHRKEANYMRTLYTYTHRHTCVHKTRHIYVPMLVAIYVVDHLINSTLLDPSLFLGCSVHIAISDVKFPNPR